MADAGFWGALTGVTDVKAIDVRFIGALMGRYVLETRAMLPGVQIFACRLQSISVRQVVASAPVRGHVGEGITVHFQPFGTIRGSIARHIEGGFCMDIDADDEERQKLASKIDWYKKRTFAGLTDKRQHKRFMPREPRSAVVMADGNVLPCLVIDLSASGAAVSADIDPMLGEPLAIGKAVGRVVRKLEVGFAVQFTTALEQQVVEEMVRAPDEWKRAMHSLELAEQEELARDTPEPIYAEA